MIKSQILTFKLGIFDIDGTLTEIRPEALARNPALVTPNNFGEQQPIHGVPEQLADLQAHGIQLALATNRGGVAFGYNTLAEAKALAQEAADLCGIPDVPVYICPYHAKARGQRAVSQFAREDNCRKPNPGMLLQALADTQLSPAQAFFVGDRETDRQAAENAGVQFFWAGQFFNEIP